MNYRKFLESKLGSFIGKARFVRVLIMKLYIRQQKKIKIAIIPGEYYKGFNLSKFQPDKHKRSIDYYEGDKFIGNSEGLPESPENPTFEMIPGSLKAAGEFPSAEELQDQTSKIERFNSILEEKGRIKTEFGDIVLVGAKHRKIKGTKLYIGVISKNADDFLDWKRENNLKGKHQSPKLFHTKDNKTYVSFATVCDTKSWSIDVLLETSLAKSNENYEQIKSVARQQLSST